MKKFQTLVAEISRRSSLSRLLLNTISEIEISRIFKKIGKSDVLIDIGGHRNARTSVGSKKTISVNHPSVKDADFFCDFNDPGSLKSIEKNISGDVVCFETIEHLRDSRLLFDLFQNVVPGGGLLCISAPFIFHEHLDPEDNFRYTRSYMIRELQYRNFSLVEEFYRGGNLITILSILEHSCSGKLSKFIIKLTGYVACFPYVLLSKYKNPSKYTTGFVLVFRKQ